MLAAVGTALPETMIPIVAILFSGEAHSDEIGVGAILGAPFMLATLAMFVTGLAVMLPGAPPRRRATSCRSTRRSSAPTCATFVIAYGIAIAAAPSCRRADLAEAARRSGVLLAVYAWYVKGHFEADPSIDVEDLAPLRFHRFDGGRDGGRRRGPWPAPPDRQHPGARRRSG